MVDTEAAAVRPRPGRLRWGVVGRWVLLIALMAAVVAAHLWYGNRHNFYDLQIYRQAVQWWRSGHDLYDFTKPDATQGQLGFTYPPFGALVLAPFGVLPWPVAWMSMWVLSVAVLSLTTFWLIAPVARRHGWPVLFTGVLGLTVVSTLEPIRETITFGQINLLLVGLVLVDLLFLVPRKSPWAGVLIGIAAAIKLTPAIFIVYLLVSRRWRAAITAIGAAAAATVLSAVVGPRASWDFWTGVLWRGEGLGNTGYAFNQSLLGAIARISAPDRPNTALWAVLVLLVLAVGLRRARRAALAGDELAGLTLAGLVGGLASPITWAHHLYWFVPAMVVLVDASATTNRAAEAAKRITIGSAWYGGLAALIAITVGLGVVSWFEQGLPVDPWAHGVTGLLIRNWYVLTAVVLLLVLPVRGAVPPPEPATVR